MKRRQVLIYGHRWLLVKDGRARMLVWSLMYPVVKK
jgi:hypothetical protein